jgi:ureidoacrylate peracid hydrolase
MTDTTATSAVLVIDMQNGFVHPDGSLPRMGLGLPGAPEAVARTAALIAEARAKSVPVLFTRHVYRDGMLDMPARMKELLAQSAGDGSSTPTILARGSWDAEVIDDLKPEPGEVVIDKNRFDAFLYTDLEVQLRALGVTRLVVCGVVTNVCVESTVRSGQQRDFEIYVAADCTAAQPEFHEPALAGMASVFGAVGPWSDAL